MDFELRNLKDFLQLYNKITQLCFNACVDNLFSRDLSQDELTCTEHCVGKFTNVNQRLMQVYVGAQTEINQRRMADMEVQAAKLAAEAQQPSAEVPAVPIVVDSTATGNASVATEQ